MQSSSWQKLGPVFSESLELAGRDRQPVQRSRRIVHTGYTGFILLQVWKILKLPGRLLGDLWCFIFHHRRAGRAVFVNDQAFCRCHRCGRLWRQ